MRDELQRKQTPQLVLQSIVTVAKTKQRTIGGLTHHINLTAEKAKIPLRVTPHEVTIALSKIEFAGL